MYQHAQKVKADQVNDDNVRVPDEEEQRAEINRVGSTLIRLMDRYPVLNLSITNSAFTGMIDEEPRQRASRDTRQALTSLTEAGPPCGFGAALRPCDLTARLEPWAK
jgi:hypothetical protein